MDWTMDHAPAGVALMQERPDVGLLDAWASSPQTVYSAVEKAASDPTNARRAGLRVSRSP